MLFERIFTTNKKILNFITLSKTLARRFTAQVPPADSVTFTEEILNGKLHFLCTAFLKYAFFS